MCEISSGGKQNQASSLDDGLDSPEDVRFKYHQQMGKEIKYEMSVLGYNQFC